MIFRLPIADRDKRAGLDAEERLFWAVMISVVVSLAVVLGLAAAHRYSFERLLIADLGLALAAAAAGRFRLRLGANARRPGLGALLPLALVVLGLWRFFPPSEYIIGGKDPGVYMNEGIQIAQRGAIGRAGSRRRRRCRPSRATSSFRRTSGPTTTACGSWGFLSRTLTPARSSASFRTSFPHPSPSVTASTA